MAYEYNSQDQRFEFPNPYKIENIFKVIGAMIFMLAGVWLLLSSKNAFSISIFSAIVPLVVGIFMFSYGGILLAKGLSNLKFYFGRNQPVGLAQEFSDTVVNTSHGAKNIKDILRQSALTYQEPHGSVNGILYSIFPNLIFSPLFIRNAAEIQFQNAIVFIITLISALIAYAGASPNSAEWLGIFYNIITLIVLLRPMATPKSEPQNIGISKVVVLVLVAILGPVLIPFITQNTMAPDWLPSMGKAIFTLVAALIAIGIFFLAVLAQMVKQPPQASAGMVQDSLSMNCQPMQLFDELERHLQNQWVGSIPNRIYSRLLPELDTHKSRGTFEGEILEETQPVPSNTLKDMTIASCFKEKNYRWLAILNTFGLFCFLASVVLLTIFALDVYNGHFIDVTYFSYGFFGLSMWILGKFCFDHGNYLWSRFDFTSDLILVEARGNYQLSQMNLGRYLDDTVKTQREIISVETMTLRVWCAEICTTTFGKYQERSILSMVSRKDEAIQLKEHLVDFAKNQSIIVTPTSKDDLNRITAMNHVNNTVTGMPSIGADKRAALPDVDLGFDQNSSTGDNQTPIVVKAKPNIFCVSCGMKLEKHMVFCPQCGTKKVS